MDQVTLELINKAKNGNKEAQEYLIENNIGLVWSIVKKFQNRGYESDDLFQIGCIGLIKAIKKFDDRFDVKFSTYAVPMIMGEIKRFIRDDGIIKVSRSLKETANKARVVKEMLTKSLGREPTIREIADKLNMEAEDLVMAMEAGSAPESLYATLNEGDSSPILLIDRIDEGSDEEGKVINRIALKQVLDTLKPREKQIIILRYFKEKTQTQIAKILGISQVQVSRIEKKILSEMKKRINAG
ncbi:RNA polymerase sporulation sigma factor SigF [Petroclostridium sp. X23]|jgi:RNA polymerase sporulation-specific sigma factor|uniref:RNA polymerase sporulation sigma factor SigF n=1 Tax=Petroclostridium sp. X23 TaxID=3045146 RepID=UPI0024AC8F2D|nr:RNA polymerase sporulation sigma factor SigF [Petroclostridium sp. X23]WHH61639.1 RNA polymerase sporulation sigma factor SigF [Petroclostridium sp. X23]